MSVPGETLDEVLEAVERIYADQRAIIETILRERREPNVAELREFDRLTAEFLRLQTTVETPPVSIQ